MASGFIVRLRPAGPWRLGPSSGARDRVDRVLHSDTLYSALTIAAERIGILAEWLAATAEATTPDVRVGSAFPFVGRTLLAPAPKHVWPPLSGPSTRTRWKAARFVPLQVVPRLLAYESLKEDRWAVDPVSEAVLPVEKFGEITPPFRVAMRRTAAVDRLTGVSGEPASTACLEFGENSGFWCAVFCAPEWRARTQSLFRLVADAGIGGQRSLGWGRSAAPEFEDLPVVLAAEPSEPAEHHEIGYWTLSLFAPAPPDRIDWSRGAYNLVRRSGRIEASGTLKIESAMVEEGAVLMAESLPNGLARNIAPEGAAHPVYRAGFAVVVPVPVRLPGFYELERAAAAETPADTAAVSQMAGAIDGAQEGGPTSSVPQPAPSEADEIPFADAPAAPVSSVPEITGDGGPEEPIAPSEPVEDSLSSPASVPPPDFFEVETEPTAEQIPPSGSADGGAFEDGPAVPEADPDADMPKDITKEEDSTQ